LDFFERNHEIGPAERLFMAENRAEDILTAKGEHGNISAQDIALISQNNYNTSMIIDQALNDIEKAESFGSTDIVLPVLSIQKGTDKSSGSSSSSGGNDIVVINSNAVLSNNKLAGTLDAEESRGVMWVLDRVPVQSGVINLNPDGGGIVSMEILGNSTKTTVSIQGGKPCMNVDIGFTTRLVENQAVNLTVNVDFFKKIMTLQNAEVKLEAQSAINLALKKCKADIFGFGEKIYETQPQLWHNISNSWRDCLSTLDVKITVHSEIANEGIISK
jgi:spore germination protein KC